jgi:hypothetical protein
MQALLRIARQDDQPAAVSARELLAERARVLGGAVALLRDLLNPDDLVVGGQAFTEYPEGMRHVEAAFADRSVLPPRDLRVTTFGNRVQEAGAGVSRWAGCTPTRSAHCAGRRSGDPPPRCKDGGVRRDRELIDGATDVVPRRVAVLSVHTSPLAQPGTGDAGGMNVYVLQTALHLARRGVEVEIFTRATASADPPLVRVAPGCWCATWWPAPSKAWTRTTCPPMRVHRGRAARRGQPRAGPLRRRALPLLAVRSGRLAGARSVGGATGAHRPHPGRGEERRAGRGTPRSRRCARSASSRWSTRRTA